MHPVRKALKARSGYFFRAPSVEGNFWPVNFVWKPTWTASRLTPAEKFSRHDANPRRRAIVNHHRGVEPLCEKDRLFRVLSELAMAKGVDFQSAPFMVAPFVPPTFVIRPRNSNAVDMWAGWPAFEEAFKYFQSNHDCRCLWLCKPANENRGIGIEVLSDLASIQSFLAGKAARSSMGLNPTWIVQKYMESPLLLHGRKFDIRVWATVCDDGTVRMFGPGYIRTSSEAFTLDSNEAFVHLTNYCMQVKNKRPASSDAGPAQDSTGGAAAATPAAAPAAAAKKRTGSFATHEPGNTLGFDDFAGYLDAQYAPWHLPVWEAGCTSAQAAYSGQPRGQELDCCGLVRTGEGEHDLPTTGLHLLFDGPNSVWHRMRCIIKGCMEGLRQPERMAGSKHGCTEYGFGKKPKDTPQHRFEFIGFDFMLDTALRPILIEVNSNPSVSYQAPWHRRMVDDMMQLLFAEHVDPILPPASDTDSAIVQATVQAALERQTAYSHTPLPVRPPRSGPPSPLQPAATPANARHSPLRCAPGAATPARKPVSAGKSTVRSRYTDGTGIEYSPGDSSGDEDASDVVSEGGGDSEDEGGLPQTLDGHGTGLVGSPELRRRSKQPAWKPQFRQRYPASQWRPDAVAARNACMGWKLVCNIFKMKSPYKQGASAPPTPSASARRAGAASTIAPTSTGGNDRKPASPVPRTRSGGSGGSARHKAAKSKAQSPTHTAPGSGKGPREIRAATATATVAARVRTSPLRESGGGHTVAPQLIRAASPIQLKSRGSVGARKAPSSAGAALPSVPSAARTVLAVPVSTLSLGSVVGSSSHSATGSSGQTTSQSSGAGAAATAVAAHGGVAARGVAGQVSRSGRARGGRLKQRAAAQAQEQALKLPLLPKKPTSGSEGVQCATPPLISPLRPGQLEQPPQ